MDLRDPGNPIDERTPALSLPLVHILNAAEDDVGRMRAALQLLDALVADRVTQAQLVAAVAALVGSSPAALDTLQELADALDKDPHFATTMTNKLAALQAAIAAITFASLQGKPTTLAGYGITDARGIKSVAAVQTAAFAAAKGVLYPCDTSAGGFTVTMPAGAAALDEFFFLDVAKTFDTKKLTLARNGGLFYSVAEDFNCDLKARLYTVRLVNAAFGFGVSA